MIKKIKILIKGNLGNQLIAGSFIMVVGSLIGGAGNYLYHLLLGRMLGPVDYGTLASLISLFYLLGIPVGTLSLVIVKFVSTFKGQKKFGAIKRLFLKLIQKILVLGTAGVLIFLLFIPLLTSFLHLGSRTPLLIVAVTSFVTLFTAVNRAFLQGILRFGLLATSIGLEVIIKLGLAVFLVFLGFKVNGAILAALIGSLAAYFFTLFSLRKFLQEDKVKEELDWAAMVKYGLPVFFSSLAFTSLYTTDIVLVRHFLPAQEAGFYSALATLGKIVFFSSSPIIMVMFPMVSEKHSNGKDYKDLLFLSSGLILLICLGITLVYFLFPELMIKILFGRQYLAASPYLFLFAIFLSFYSFSCLLTNFYLSIKKAKAVILPIVAAFVQIILISFFHQSLSQVIWISIFVLSLLFISLLLYYLKSGKNTS